MFARLDRVELKQLETDKKLEEVFNYLAANIKIKQNIFSMDKYMMHLALL